ncbi:hypothetical protein ACFS2C_16110 [Prauserella oleivorans]|uniref:Uncharacterized protein n=1 Tax=Prauserella oleivorans TaxID=1478153 RepID=A0ABW5WCD8_9PSEU
MTTRNPCDLSEVRVHDNRRSPLTRTDRVRVSRKTQEVRVHDNRRSPLTRTDRVRVSRKTQEAV